MAHVSPSVVTRRSLGAGLGLVVALLLGSIAIAPSAWAGHSDLNASVECIDGQRVLDWTWTAYRHQTMDPPVGTVYVQFGNPGPIGGPRDIEIGGGPLVDETHTIANRTTLVVPAGATQVRVSVGAQWFGNTGPISWLESTTAWLALPEPCVVADSDDDPPQDDDDEGDEEDTTSTTADDTTTTTAAAGVSATTDPPAGVAGVSAVRPAAVPAQAVSTQTVSTQTLPDTGSTSGVLAAGAVLMIAAGGALISVSRRSLHPITVSTSDPTEPR